MNIAILTISDSRAANGGPDASGDAIAAWAAERGHALAARATVADDTVAIARTLVEWCDHGTAHLVITTGGTGFGPRDVTPEATRAVLDREAPAIATAIQMADWPGVPTAILSRGVAGSRGRALIVNLPGSPNGVRTGLHVLTQVAEHAVRMLSGDTEH